jgi:hypothetical protein
MFEYLAKYPEIKKQKEAAKKVERAADASGRAANSGAAAAPARSLENVFVYRPNDATYTIEVKFDSPGDRNRRGILTALKQAFDDVKNEKIEM